LNDIDENIKEWPLPKPMNAGNNKFEFINSAGLRYEAEDFRRCINEGLLECPTVTHNESLTIARIQDEIRRQLGMRFDVD
jgi:dihydrodiol dehydrogenase / D-xylose 1-dehydrogenase (NADP)